MPDEKNVALDFISLRRKAWWNYILLIQKGTL